MLLLVFAAASLAAQPYHIAFGNLPDDPEYQRLIGEFFPLYNLVSVRTADWQADVSKQAVVRLIETLRAETEVRVEQSEKPNVDVLLFRALLKVCSFNLGIGEYHADLVRELEALKKEYPDDYRPSWMLANHYAFADEPQAAVREFQYLVEQLLQGRLPPDMINDYLTVLYMAQLFSRCKETVDAIAETDDAADKETLFWMYPFLERQLKAPPLNGPIAARRIFTFLQREDESGFLCRAFGIWLPIENGFQTRTFPVARDGSGGLALSFPLESKTGRRILSGIRIVFQARPAISFAEYQESLLKGRGNPVVGEEDGLPWEAVVYEIRDPQLYPEDGGGHGFVVFCTRPEPAVKGLAIEAPSRSLPTTGVVEPGAAAAGEGFTRFDGDIYYAFFLDTCEDVFPAAKALFFSFLERVRLD